jgi:hypothetical protein
VTEEFYRELRIYVAERGLKLVEVLELGLEALKERDRLGLPPLDLEKRPAEK